MHTVASLTAAGRIVTVVLACALVAPQFGRADRRDPFVPPTSSLNPRPECHGSGLASLRIEDLAPTGIVSLGRNRWALLVGPDGRSHAANEGTRLCDGIVASITAAEVSFEQVADPFSTRRPPQRITKALHIEGDAR
jgi:hypothetical protein